MALDARENVTESERTAALGTLLALLWSTTSTWVIHVDPIGIFSRSLSLRHSKLHHQAPNESSWPGPVRLDWRQSLHSLLGILIFKRGVCRFFIPFCFVTTGLRRTVGNNLSLPRKSQGPDCRRRRSVQDSVPPQHLRPRPELCAADGAPPLLLEGNATSRGAPPAPHPKDSNAVLRTRWLEAQNAAARPWAPLSLSLPLPARSTPADASYMHVCTTYLKAVQSCRIPAGQIA